MSNEDSVVAVEGSQPEVIHVLNTTNNRFSSHPMHPQFITIPGLGTAASATAANQSISHVPVAASGMQTITINTGTGSMTIPVSIPFSPAMVRIFDTRLFFHEGVWIYL